MSANVKQFHEEEAISKFDRGSVRRLLRYLRPYRRLIVPALLLTLLVNALGVVEPKFFQYAIDWYIAPADGMRGTLAPAEWEGVYNRLSWGLAIIALALLGVKLVQFAVSYLQTVLLQSVGQHVMYDLRAELYEKLQRQEVAFFDRNPVGRVMTRLTSDVDALNELFTSGVIEGLGDVVMVFAIIGFMLWMDW
ncbi:MAG TPA: ABC transporter transmembrane domain-containing protein, partial [Pyrinomonadaceae bacterium]|nr:ABC transporter transmembrane domain-containing protein [Pyrinomonadaceae bacterium]